MAALRNLALAIFTIAFLTFAVLFGRLPALRNTPIAFLHRAIRHRLPNAWHRLDERLTGGRLSNAFAGLGNYLMHEKHPLVLFFYLGLLTACTTLFLHETYPRLSTRQLAPLLVLVPLPYLFAYHCAYHPPTAYGSYITPSNHSARMRDYPYDHILFRPGQLCRTCGLVKPARSKHCSICNVCVAKCDHHCIWVNNCLGRSNYKHFLLMLLSTAVVEYYGAYLAFVLLRPYLHLPASPTPTSVFSRDTASRFLAMLVSATEAGGLSIAGVGLLAFYTAPLPLGLLAYHVYLIWAGMTTNESAKWADWREDMHDGVVFKARRSVALTADEDGARVWARGTAYEGRRSGGNASPAQPHGNPKHAVDEPDHAHTDADAETDDVDGTLEPHTPWPASTDQLVVRTTDGRCPTGQEGVAGSAPIWERCWRLAQVENVYDLGFWDNARDAFAG
ncbi:hypothetical protein B0A49_01086 [Cryomyces minteri]|uniref:Palmitoyltransferase n=1 Tax=Cryomyces minteri TaxID=331657 RepID=A0A4U0XPZ1_9PEZI|nr:hypothetical protein B0A49_01086 [Cryomyces minteri]